MDQFLFDQITKPKQHDHPAIQRVAWKPPEREPQRPVTGISDLGHTQGSASGFGVSVQRPHRYLLQRAERLDL